MARYSGQRTIRSTSGSCTPIRRGRAMGRDSSRQVALGAACHLASLVRSPTPTSAPQLSALAGAPRRLRGKRPTPPVRAIAPAASGVHLPGGAGGLDPVVRAEQLGRVEALTDRAQAGVRRGGGGRGRGGPGRPKSGREEGALP